MFEDLGNYLRELWEAGTLWLYEALLGLLLAIINLFPMPAAMQNMDSYWSAIPESVWWLLSAFQIDTGISIVVSAWIIRFFIRRIPGIG